MTDLTEAQRAALRWLKERNGTGVVGKDGVIVAAGERAPFMRSTWTALKVAGLVSIEFKRVNVIA